MKKTGICPKCDSQKIGFIENVLNKTQGTVGSRQVVGYPKAPVGITRSETSSGFLGSIVRNTSAGELEAFFCTECGFFETYIKNPAELDYEKIEGFKMINQ